MQSSENNASSYLGSKQAWFIWSLSVLAFGYAFFHRVAPSVLVNDLMVDLSIGAGVLGTLSSLYFYPYVMMQIPLGVLLDVYGPRILLTLALITGGIGSYIFGAAESIYIAYLGRILIGIGCAVGFLATLSITSKWFAPNQFAFMSGLLMFFGLMIGMFGAGPLALFIERFGWRNSMYALAIFSFVLASAIYLFVKNEPPTSTPKENILPPAKGLFWSNLKQALKSKEAWKLAIVALSMSGPMLAMGALWATPYLMAKYQLSTSQAAFFSSLMLIGWAVCAPTLGWLSQKLQKRKAIIITAGIVEIIALILLITIPHLSLFMTILLLVIIGGAGSGMAICFVLVREVSPNKITSSVTGIVNSMTVASGAILQPAVGYILDYRWDGTLIKGAKYFQPLDYRIAFSVILLVSAIGLVTACFAKETTVFAKNN